MILTQQQARQIALTAQGFGNARRSEPSASAVAGVIDRLGIFQIDSVNVLARAHYLPLFSRLGPYDPDLLHQAAGWSGPHHSRRLIEYWAHEAALLDVRWWPAFEFRRRLDAGMRGGPRVIAEEKPEFVRWVLTEVEQRGPLTARQIKHDFPRTKHHWGWNWSEVKMSLEHLFYVGTVMAASRNSQFERVYDLAERVLPAEILNAAPLAPDEAHRQLVSYAATAHGVGTEACLRDYFRLAAAPTRQAIAELLASGELLPVTIEGWKRPAYLHQNAIQPRTVDARALLSPFDPLIFERTRTERLFDFKYRIEIYVPAAKRVYGYYVLPFLLGDQLVARVDLKADRSAKVLRVHSAWKEPFSPPDSATELAKELQRLADWLGMDSIEPPRVGDLAGQLADALVSVLGATH